VAVVLPVKGFSTSKSRLAPTLCPTARIAISQLMLKFTLNILLKLEFVSHVIVVSYDSRVRRIAETFGVDFVYENSKGVNAAVNAGDRFCRKFGINSNIVIPTDLCFLNVEEISLIYYHAVKFPTVVVLCPSVKRDGTNFLLRNPLPLFETSFDNNSYYNHLESANKSNAHLILLDSPTLGRDIDTTHDMLEAIEFNPTNRLTGVLRRIITKIPT
jgi:2-phospho-L-lactate guanylyltransferase